MAAQHAFVICQALPVVVDEDTGDVAEHVTVARDRQPVEVFAIEHRRRGRGGFDVLRDTRGGYAVAFRSDFYGLQVRLCGHSAARGSQHQKCYAVRCWRKELDGRALTVNEARPREERSGGGGGGRY